MPLPRPSRRSVLSGSAFGLTLAGFRSTARAVDVGRAVDTPVTDVPLALPGVALRTSNLLRTGPMPVPAYSLLGVTWYGSPDAEVRVRTRTAGAWSAWTHLPRLHDAPDRGTEGRPDLVSTTPRWVGSADGVDVEVRGARTPVLHLVDARPREADHHHHKHHHGHHHGHHHHGHHHHGHHKHRHAHAPAPDVLPRVAWGADESWRDGGPYYNRTVKQVHVHHTASGNDYAPEDVPAILRAIYRYHTHSNGWSDIAYNFLVDQWGEIWEGRYGGITEPVRGAHTLGFNNTSTGIAVIGNYDEVAPSAEVLKALSRIAAWKLDHYGRSPAGTTHVRSTGSDDFPDGDRVDLPVIDGHRDTNDTECPGQLLYDALGDLRARAQARADRYNPHDGR